MKTKKDFPFFKHNDVTYLDSAATAHKPQCVIDSLTEAYSKFYSPVHRSSYKQGIYMSELFEKTRKKIAEFINAEPYEIIFTSNATDAINLVANSLFEQFKNRTVTISRYEHNSNFFPWERLYNVEYIPDKNGKMILDKNFKPSRGIIAVPHITNTTGIINPIKKLAKLAHKNDCLLFVDGAQGIVHQKVDVKKIDCDFYCFSGHKIYGPTGIGVLFVKESILKHMSLYKVGGGTVNSKIPNIFEAGTPNFVQALGLQKAIEYLTKIGIEKIIEHEHTLFEYLKNDLKNLSFIKIIGNPECSLISFLVEGIHPLDVDVLLGEQNIAIRAGGHCSELSMNEFQLSSTIRASLGIYNSISDISKLINALSLIEI